MRYILIMNGSGAVDIVDVTLPPALAKRVVKIASDLGLSCSEVIRIAIRWGVPQLSGKTETAAAPVQNKKDTAQP